MATLTDTPVLLYTIAPVVYTVIHTKKKDPSAPMVLLNKPPITESWSTSK